MQDIPKMVKVPSFPRHIANGEKRHVLAVEWAEEETARDAISLEKEFGRFPNGKEREILTFANLMLIKHSWADERITDLEKQLAGAMKKIARLSRRLEEVTDDA